MNPLPLELEALAFQALVTLMLAVVHAVLWRHGRARYHAAWTGAWLLYAARLLVISVYLVDRRPIWLFAHQAVTVLTAVALLWAALLFRGNPRWRPAYLAAPIAAVAWAWFSVLRMGDMALAGVTSAVLMSAVTLWTGVVYWRTARERGSAGATLLAWTFWLWGLHHLDYPLLRALGTSVVPGVFVDVCFIVVVALGSLTMVAEDSRRALARRTEQLEELTHRVLRAQEDERRRVARELHDEAGQALTAVKIELDLAGRTESSALVGRVLDQIRNVSNLLRPPALDDLGLEPALEALARDFERRTAIAVDRDLGLRGPACSPEVQVAVYRVVQEALTNVARHSGARRVRLRAQRQDDTIELEVADDGRGASDPTPHLGLLGMRERVTELGGRFDVETRPLAGFRIAARLPSEARP